MSKATGERQALSRARKAKNKLARTLEARSDIAGIGLTMVGDALGVKVNLTAAPSGPALPASVDGVPVVVEVVGTIRKR
jgi:hypothetical protein